MDNSKTTSLYYGWKLVAAILVILTFASGLSFYNHAVFLNALSSQPQFTVETVSLGVTFFFLSTGFSGLVVARWIEKTDPRYCIIFGAIAASIAISAIGYIQNTLQLYLVYILFGAGFSASSLIPATTIVSRWFVRKRAVALSVASTGLSLGGVIVTPVSALMVENMELQQALYIMSAMYVFGVIPTAWIWLRPDPQSMGFDASNTDYLQRAPVAATDDSAPSADQNASLKPESDGISFRQATKLRFFWGLCSAFTFLMLAQVGGIAHQYGLARETLTEAQTALALAILPVASIFGRLIGGWVVELFAIHRFAIGMMVLQVCALCLLALGDSPLTLCIGLACFGLTVGNLLMLQPLLIAEAFGLKEYARIFSISNLLTSWGTASGPAILGFAYAANQNDYSWSYLAAALAGLIGLVLFISGGRMPGGKL